MNLNPEKMVDDTSAWNIKEYSTESLFHNSIQFSIILQPHKDELLSSWLTRLAHKNLTKVSSILRKLDYRLNGFDIDLDANENFFKYLNEKTRISIQTIKEMALLPLLDKLSKFPKTSKLQKKKRHQSLWFTDWNANLDRYHNGIRYCPECLKEDETPYFRKSWRYGFNPICVKHQCYLLDKCPSCGKAITYYWTKWDCSILECSKCGTNITQAKVQYLSSKDPLLKLMAKFLEEMDIERVNDILIHTWFIASHVGLFDWPYIQHPLTKDKQIQILWLDNFDKANKLPIFRNMKYLFLVIGITLQLMQSKKELMQFYSDHYTSARLLPQKQSFQCPLEECDFLSVNLAGVIAHQWNHQRMNYVCVICFEAFQHKQKWRKHLNDHQKKDCECKICYSQFSDLTRLKGHMQFHSLSKIFCCSECGTFYTTKGMLTIHSRKHTGKRPYLCNICDERFKSAAQLTEHKKIHTNIKTYICPYCKEKFRRKGTLITHIRTHTGEKPFVCDFCGKGFAQSSTLTAHKRIHTGEKPFLCDICGDRFSEKGTLKRHQRIHSGKKPFSCSICSESFRTRASRNRHVKSHSEDRPYHCKQCDKSYKRKDHLQRHIRNQHPTED